MGFDLESSEPNREDDSRGSAWDGQFPLRSPNTSLPQVSTERTPPAEVTCWRCEKGYPSDLSNCHWCRAVNRSPTNRASAPSLLDSAEGSTRQLKIVFWTFGLLLLGTIILALVLRGITTNANLDETAIDRLVLQSIVILEVIDSVIVVVAWKMAGSINSVSQPGSAWRAWLLAPLLLGGLIGLNFAYHAFLNDWLGLDPDESQFNSRQLFTLILWTHCIQPAVIEELFIRHLMLDTLRKYTSAPAAIWISSLAFALLHLGVPLSIPYLFVAGLLFGYLRVASGSLWLPILAHFIHNLIVVGYDYL